MEMILIENKPLWEKAVAFIQEKHQHQKRMGGLPYATHPLAVANILYNKGFGESFLLAALYHDLLEDTDATEEEILALGGQEPALVLDAVKRVTKVKGYKMPTYIKGISEQFLSKMVKLADRLHNLNTAIDASVSFQQRYIQETKEYYIDLAKDTVFEKDIKEALSHLEMLQIK